MKKLVWQQGKSGEAARMKRGIGVLAVAVAAMAALVLPSAASAQVIQDANCPGPGDNLDGVLNGGRYAQTFTALNTNVLTRAEVDIFNPGGAQDWIFQINTVDGGGVPTNTVLATTTVPDTTVDAAIPAPGEGRLGANFATPASVTMGQSYALVLTRPPDGFTSVDNVGDGTACPGDTYQSPDQDDPFSVDTTDDMVFAVFVGLPQSMLPVTQTQPAQDPRCDELRRKLRRQKRKLKKADSEQKKDQLKRNIDKTRERRAELNC